MSSRNTPKENKAAASAPASLAEINAAADEEQAQSNKRAASGKPATNEELAKSGYVLPDGFLEQDDPNAGHRSAEQRAGDGGADNPGKA